MEAWRRILLLTLIRSLLSAASYSQDRFYRIKRVVDGDTLLLTNGERARLIGVDTPEVHESKKLHRDAERTGRDIKTIITLGKNASAFTKSLTDEREVRLKHDQANAYINHRDKYGRLLAYVYISRGDLGKEALEKYGYKDRASAVFMLNAKIIKQGYGFAYTRFPFKYIEEFRRYEREARENRRGLWGEEFQKMKTNKRRKYKCYEKCVICSLHSFCFAFGKTQKRWERKRHKSK